MVCFSECRRTAWSKDVLICLCNRSKTSGAVFRSSKALSPSLPGSLVVRIRRSHRPPFDSRAGKQFFWPPLALTRRERPAKSNSSFEPESNQRPKDVCLFNYSPPLYQLSYRRSWRWSGQDLLLCPSHDPKRVFILAPHTVSKTCHK